MFYRVLKAFKYKDARDLRKEATPGMAVDILGAKEADRLMASGRIGHIDLPPLNKIQPREPAPATARTIRVGLFLFTSTHYSGGRIHLFQYAHSVVQNGGEVFYYSNTAPKWRRDYPENGIKYLMWGQDGPPNDLDVIMTDGKGAAAGHAMAYKAKHPNVKLCLINFESRNWISSLIPNVASKVSSASKSVMLDCDLLVANSRESSRWLIKWLGKPKDVFVLPPAVNTYAISASSKTRPAKMTHPYAVWSGRGPMYKGHNAALKAIWSLKTPFDLVSFGNPKERPRDTKLHRFISMSQKSDADKFALMRHAEMTLAPSLFEGFGMVPAESLAVGTPVVVYDLPVLREEYAGIEGMNYVKWKDAKAFARKVAALAKAPKQKLDPKPVLDLLGMPAMAKRVDRMAHHALKRTRVTAQMISYWGFIPETLEAVYPHVDEIVIAYGPDKNAIKIDDGSLERIKAFPDPDGKIKLCVRKQWSDKQDMRAWCHRNSTGNYNLILDGDEIWVGLDEWIKAKVHAGCPRWVTLWHNAKHHVVALPAWKGARWGNEIKPYGCICNHYRWSWLRPSYRWTWHCRLEACGKKPIKNAGSGPAQRLPACAIYHLGHVLPKEIMLAKHKFYRKRDGDNPGRKQRQKAWHGWNGKTGDCGDGIVKKIDWNVPDIVKRAVASAKKIRVR